MRRSPSCATSARRSGSAECAAVRVRASSRSRATVPAAKTSAASGERHRLVQPVGDLRRRAGGEHRAVDRADAGADDEVGADARVEQRAQHADLHGAEHSPAAEHDGGADAFRGHRPMLARAVGQKAGQGIAGP